MRDAYYILLQKYHIQDTLGRISTLSYSRKTAILVNLLSDYIPSIINMALNDYEVRYINIHRVDLKIIQNVLKGLCKKYKSQMFEKMKEN